MKTDGSWERLLMIEEVDVFSTANTLAMLAEVSTTKHRAEEEEEDDREIPINLANRHNVCQSCMYMYL